MNAIDILKHAAVEYPKHPTQGKLVKFIGGSSFDTASGMCFCLLGQLGVSGGCVPTDLLTRADSDEYGIWYHSNYDILDDGNGIREAVYLLAEVITGFSDVRHETFNTVLQWVYAFNDRTLIRVAGRSTYTEKSVAAVVAKIHEAIALGESRL